LKVKGTLRATKPHSLNDKIVEDFELVFKGVSNMTQSELDKKGANFSLIHVDFMVGGPELDITTYEKDGTEVQLFRNGNWVF
jgi:leucyl aminopeptidase (aminopeptidase T)